MSDSAVPLPAGVRLDDGLGGLPVLHVECRSCTGEICLYGAHVLDWTPVGAAPVIWMSEEAVFERGTAIRGGVPICAPWFGGGKDGDRSPAHGWFRTSDWELDSVREVDDGVVVTLGLARDDLEASYEVGFGATLRLALTVSVRQPLELEEALHTYLTVGDITQCRVEGLDERPFLDKVQGGRDRQRGPIVFTAETDRVYDHDGSATLVDPVLGRRIVVTKQGSATTVVWNPWLDKAAGMADFGDDEWPGMCCIEVANALRSFVPLAPGEKHTMVAEYKVIEDDAAHT